MTPFWSSSIVSACIIGKTSVEPFDPPVGAGLPHEVRDGFDEGAENAPRSPEGPHSETLRSVTSR